MKHFIKMAFYLLSIICIFGISSCERELYDLEPNNEKKGTINYLTINEAQFLIPSIINYNEDYKFLKEKKTLQYAAPTLNLNLDLERILEYVKENGEKSYSIIIKKDFLENEDKYFTNLHIVRKDLEYKPLIIKYNSVDDSKLNPVDLFTGKIELFDINNVLAEHANYLNGIETLKKIVVLGPWHITFHDGTVDVEYVESDEESSGEGSSGGDNNDSSETGNDGNNNSNGNTASGNGGVVIPNVPCVNCPTQGIDANEIPCENLKELSDPEAGNIKPNIDWLIDKVNDPTNDKEHGISFKKSVLFDNTTQYVNTNVSSPDKNSIDLPKDCKYIGGAHCHTPDGYQMYSFADVKWLRDAYDQACNGNKPNVVSMLVVKNEVTNVTEVFSITVNNIDQLNNYLDTTLNSSDFEGMNINEKIFKIQEKQAKNMENNKNNLLLNFVATFGSFGISVFKANDDTLENWSKVDVIPNPDSTAQENFILDLTPCN